MKRLLATLTALRRLIAGRAQAAVDFAAEIKPILETSCLQCHDAGKTKGKLQLVTAETLAKGGDSGAAVVAGKAGGVASAQARDAARDR